MAKYHEQHDRMMRWYERYKSLDHGRPHTMASDNYLDEIHAFFQSAHHLGDWLVNDGAVTKSVVQAFIQSKDCLKLCADICNASKHLKLNTQGWSKENPEFGKKVIGLSLGTGPTTITIESYMVDTNTKGSIEAFKLATECVDTWKAFFTTHNL